MRASTNKGLPSVLVHVCCAADALYVLGLLKEKERVTAFFYNPNIHPAEEYGIRLEEMRKVAEILDVPLLEGEYEPEQWHELTRKFINDPEKGRRCDICYALRLKKTAILAAERGHPAFATVMSLSPWKKAGVINRIGEMFGQRYHVRFRSADFKKKDGFKKSVELSRRHGLYRQNYCGCLYSRRTRNEPA